jgi:probable HAF family extracellular repeat protein
MAPESRRYWTVFALTWTLAAGAHALPVYTIKDIGPANNSFRTSISNGGHVAGTFDFVPRTIEHAFLYTPGVGFQDLGSFGEGQSSVTGVQAVNDAGQVAGAAAGPVGSSWQASAFLYSSSAGMQPLGTLGGAHSRGQAINNLGHVAGWSTTSSGELRMFLHDGNGMTDLGALGETGNVTAMNDAGQITGWRTTDPFSRSIGFVYTPGAGFTRLATLGGTESVGIDINEAGFVAGTANTDERIPDKGGFYLSHAAIFAPDGTATDLGVLGDNRESFATGINDAGLVVGQSGATPFLYADGAMVDLTTMLEAQSAEGWTSIEVHDINNDGLISGRGFFNGESRAFVLTPTEPGGGQCPVSQSALRAAVAAVKERFGG